MTKPLKYVPLLSDVKLRREKNGVIYAHWTEPAAHTGGHARTRWRSLKVRDMAVAKQLIPTIFGGQAVAPVPAHRMSVADLLFEYEKHLDMILAGPTQLNSLRTFARYYGSLWIEDVSAATYNEYRYRRTMGHIHPSGAQTNLPSLTTVYRELGAIRSLFNYAVQTGLLGWCPPFKTYKTAGGGTNTARQNTLSIGDLVLLRTVCRSVLSHPRLGRAAMFTLIATYTGARAKAIEGLTWDRVDIASPVGIIDFRDPNVRSSRKRRVVLPISSALRATLQDWATFSQPGCAVPTGPVLGHTGSTRKGFDAIKNLTWGKGSAIAKELTRHDLRRTWATLAVSSGVSLAVVGQVLGDSIKIVEKHYAHLAPAHLTTAMQAV